MVLGGVAGSSAHCGSFSDIPEPVDPQICQVTCAVMKLSFEEEYRRAMNELGKQQQHNHNTTLNNHNTTQQHHDTEH